MKILLAPDSFKGTFTSVEVIQMLSDSLHKNLGQHEVVKVPVADGGEGTMESLVLAANGVYRKTFAKDAMGKSIHTRYGVIWGDTAVVEVASVAGLTQITEKKRNPLNLSSYGFGELISNIIDDGFKKILLGIGGSATNDGGMGMLTALGAKFYGNGVLLNGLGKDLEKVDDVDLSCLRKELKEIEMTVICDVTNPLLGEHGATYIYGPQKGATGKMADRLEAGMKHYANVIREKLGLDICNVPGAGAAGGIGAALGGILNATMKNGIETILEAVHFDDLLQDVTFVVTGEGKLDGQSVKYGKVPVGIAKHCQAKGIPVAIIAGVLGEGWEKILEIQKCSVMSTIDYPLQPEDVLKDAKERFISAADRMFRFIGLV